jgi:hypothetical protein
MTTPTKTEEPTSNNQPPMICRWPNDGGKSETGREAKWSHGVYFPDTDLFVSEMGGRSTGKPAWAGLEWIDVELHTMQLAAIMTASIQNTNESAAARIDRSNPYWTVAYDDVCKAVDREMGHRRELEFLKAEHKDVTEALKDCSTRHDMLVERSVGAMQIAEGDEGWDKIPLDCPMLEAVAKLRKDFDQAMKDLATLRACVGGNP